MLFWKNKKSIIDVRLPHEVGYHAKDGTVYVGQNEKGEHCYTTPETLDEYMNESDAKRWLNGDSDDPLLCGHRDWDLATFEEAKELLLTSQKVIGGFKQQDYLTSTKYEGSRSNVKVLTFKKGDLFGKWDHRDPKEPYAIRPIRRSENLVI